MLGPAKFLQRLEPTRRILGVVNTSRGMGLSLSDPYLSFSKPLLLDSAQNMLSISKFVDKLPSVMREHDCGGILIGRQMGVLMTVQDEVMQQAELTELLKQEGDLIQQYPCTTSDLDCDKATYDKEIRENLLWEGLKVGDSDFACDHSALSMQVWLDEHCGGWANTFG